MKRSEDRKNNNLVSNEYEKMLDEKLVKSDNSENKQKDLRDMNEENIEECIDFLAQKIENEFEQIPVPDSLSPENIKKRLVQKKKKAMRYFAEIAAAIVLVVALGGTGVYKMITKDAKEELQMNTKQETRMAEMDEMQADEDGSESQIENVTHEKKIGDYRQAKNYEEVYALLSKYQDTAKNETSMDMGGISEPIAKNDTTSNATEESTKKQNDDFSKTNTLQDGIDESDFVKNDADNLFVQDDSKVSIIDISGEKMHLVSTIEPKLENTDTIREMYADTKENRVVLIIERQKESEIGESSSDTKNGFIEIYSNHMDESSVIMQTYDIADRAKPKLIGSITMDGRYKDSRKMGQTILLFTTKLLQETDINDKGNVIPTINGEKMKSDCIYIGKEMETELIMASVDLAKPDQTIDQMTIMGGYPEIYMSNNALYLYESVYEEDDDYTKITRFAFQNGYLGTGESVKVKGEIRDKFAISEGNGIVRVLTTLWRENGSTNELHLYDCKMNEKGSLKDIAKGEEIYAARYIGDIAYFITYHNTDPLFAVDISDVSHPKMLGNVKMTGYSDYLHPYGDNLLLGVGYETDPDTSEQLGVKLTMFDTSDPVNLKILDSVVIKDADTCATNDYKTVLADTRKNLIGFSVENYREKYEDSTREYLVYRWKNNHFEKVLSQDLGEDITGEMLTKTRGIYAGTHFYCISRNAKSYQVKSYDMEDDFTKLDLIKL